MAEFVQSIQDFTPGPGENLHGSILKEYERIIIESLITSFGLDIFINDRHGGDVDTVHNVRQIGVDPEMVYKNMSNQAAYDNRPEYNFGDYHKDPRFRSIKHEAREKWQETGVGVTDAYEGHQLYFFKNEESYLRAELDHIVECKGIHEDRGRVLSGLNGVDLANSPDNLAWTNKSLNASMGSWARAVNDAYKKEHGCDAPLDMVDMRAYLAAHPDDFDEATKKRMLSEFDRAKKAYDAKINKAYYTSKAFFKDASSAAVSLGAKMGLRQALGFVFSEIWFTVKEELSKPTDTDEALLRKIGTGVKNGFEKAKEKYKEIFEKFINGAIAGVLSSLTTTICNIFFTTAKSLVRILRQSWASLVEATKILLFNPDCLPFGERFRAGAKVIATGASIVLGTFVNEAIAKTGVGAIPVVGEIVSTFCGTLVTGILSCSLLTFIDHNKTIATLVGVLNSIPTADDVVNYHRMLGRLLDEYVAKLESIDIEKFENDVDMFYEAAETLSKIKDEEAMNKALHNLYKKYDFQLPWDGDFDTFMEDRSRTLSFS